MNEFAELLTPSNITFIIGLLGMLFTVYYYFKNPQIRMDKKPALDEAERRRKDDLIEERIKWEREANEKKFCDFGTRLDKSMELAQNHTHSVDVKVDKLIQSVNTMDNEITRLGTIIEERIPKK